MRCSPALFLLPLALSSSLALGVQVSSDPNALQLGVSLVLPIGRGQNHRFSVNLERDQFAHVVVDQRGVDVIVRVYAAERTNVTEFDSPNGATGLENVKIVAVAAGVHVVDVAPLLPQDTASGQFEIRLREIRRATEPELQVARRPEILKAKGMALLVTLSEMLPEVRSLQARVRHQVQVAQLLRPNNESASRRIALDAMAGAREFIGRDVPEDADQNERFNVPTQMRQEVFQMLMQQDPELALNFLRTTRSAELQNGIGQPDQEGQMEMQAASSIATKDARRAFQVAQEALSRGYPSQLGGVISSIRMTDPQLAARLMKDAVAKLQEERLTATPEAASFAVNLLQAARSANSRPPGSHGNAAVLDVPLLSPLEFRSLFAKVLEDGLSVEFVPNVYSPEMNSARVILQSLKSMSDEVRAIAPGKIGLIDEKLALMNSGSVRDRVYRDAINTSSVEVALDAISRAPLDLRDSLYNQLSSKVAGTDVVRARQIATSFIVNPQQRQMALDNVERQAVQAAINTGKLEEAMDIIRKLKGRRERVNMINQMLYRIGQGQKADVAMNVLEQSRALVTVSSRPEDQEQMNALLLIAGAFSRFDAEKGFQIVEPLIDQFNDLMIAAVALNGFGQQYFQNGEFSMNNGNSLSNTANQFAQALAKLATVDFDRAKNAVDRIQRPEVRAAVYFAMAQMAINQVLARG